MGIIIDKEFQALIPPLSDDEYRQLEENCIRDGIRDPLVTWPQDDGTEILIDGHNRWEISAKNAGIPFKIVKMRFESRAEAKNWIIKNQLGRRNVALYARYELMKFIEPEEKAKAKERQGTRTDIVESLPPCNKGKTRDIMGAKLGVSGRQYDKLTFIDKNAPEEIKEKARTGEISTDNSKHHPPAKKSRPGERSRRTTRGISTEKGFRDCQRDGCRRRQREPADTGA